MDDNDDACCNVCLFCVSPIVAVYVLFIGVTIIMADPPILVVPGVQTGTLYVLDFDDSSTSATVTYNLSAVFSFRNPNFRQVRVHQLAAAHSYSGQNLGLAAPLQAPFELLGGKVTTTVPLELQGRQVVDAASAVSRSYAEDADRGYYSIEAKIHLRGGQYGLTSCDSTCTIYFPEPPTDQKGLFTLFAAPRVHNPMLHNLTISTSLCIYVLPQS